MSIDQILSNETLLRWLFLASLVSFVGALLFVPLIVTRLPADYFSRPDAPLFRSHKWHPLIRVPLFIAKNLAALVCIVLGTLMLVLPGQGILTIIVGLLLLDFPGKYHTERWLIRRKWLLRLFNRIRARADKGPFAV